MKYILYFFSIPLILIGSIISVLGIFMTITDKQGSAIGSFIATAIIGFLPLYLGILIFKKIRKKENEMIQQDSDSTEEDQSEKNLPKNKRSFFNKRIFETPPLSVSELIIDSTNDYKQLRLFLDEWSLKSNKVIDHLGSHMEIISTSQEPNFLFSYDVLTIFRPIEKSKLAGTNYEVFNGSTDPYFYDYETPAEFKSFKTKESKILLSTVKTFSCVKKVTCNTCSGNGKCVECNGKGSVICGKCNGEGEVRNSVRNKTKSGYHIEKERCYSCSGSGKKSCSRCSGRGKCNPCSGSGELTCPECNGLGNYQTYDTFTTEYFFDNKKFAIGVNNLEPNDFVKATGDEIFNRIILEYKTADNAIVDAIKSVEEIIPQNYKENLLKIKYLSNDQKGRLCKLKVNVQKYKSIQVKYLYDEKEFFLEIFGNNHMIFAPTLPHKSLKEKFSINNILRLFTRNMRYVNYLRVSIFILWSDGELASEEKNIFLDMLNSSPLKKQTKDELLKFLDEKLTFEDIKLDLDKLRKDKNILSFIWHMISADSVIADKELESFNMITNYYNLSNTDVEKLKGKVSGYMRLDTKKLLKEYVEK